MIFAHHHDDLVRYAERCLRWTCREIDIESEDLVQDALLLVLDEKLEWRGSIEQFLATLRATVANLSRNPERFRRKLVALEDQKALPIAKPVDTDRAAYQALVVKNVSEALATLPPEMSRAVSGCWLQGSTAAQVAADQNKAEKTVRNHLDRARRRLQPALAVFRPS